MIMSYSCLRVTPRDFMRDVDYRHVESACQFDLCLSCVDAKVGGTATGWVSELGWTWPDVPLAW